MATPTLKKRKASGKQLPKIPIPQSLFHTTSVYLCSPYVSRNFLSKLRIFFNSVDTLPYREDTDLVTYYDFVTRFIDIAIENEINEPKLIIDKILESPVDSEEIGELLEDYILADIDEMQSNLAMYVENEFIARFNFINIDAHTSKVKEAISRYESGDYDNFEEAVAGVFTSSNSLIKACVPKSSQQLSLPDLATTSADGRQNFLSAMSSVIKRMNDPKLALKTGIKRLNQMLGGGYMGGNVYIYNATSGGWKSSMLLNTVFQVMKYNKNFSCYDQAKRPCALYISQENDNHQTSQRMVSYVRGVKPDGKPLPEDEVLDLLRKEGIIDGRWTLELRYIPKGKISTGDLDTIISEIESAGEVEVKILVHDYIKRIMPDMMTGDLRLDLGEVVNDFSILAKRRNIPIVTANQLNREAFRALNPEDNDGKMKGAKHTDVGRRINASMISESQMVYENADVMIALHREKSRADGRTYLAIKNLKDRNDKTGKVVDQNSSYFVHPFEEGNGMRLDEDLLLATSLSMDSIGESISVDDEDDDVVEAVSVASRRESRSKATALEVEE